MTDGQVAYEAAVTALTTRGESATGRLFCAGTTTPADWNRQTSDLKAIWDTIAAAVVTNQPE